MVHKHLVADRTTLFLITGHVIAVGIDPAWDHEIIVHARGGGHVLVAHREGWFVANVIFGISRAYVHDIAAYGFFFFFPEA